MPYKIPAQTAIIPPKVDIAATTAAINAFHFHRVEAESTQARPRVARRRKILIIKQNM
jgi:hypothetical protein